MIIGVTGGIGSGKSNVCGIIGYKCGFTYVDTDSIIKDKLMYYIPIATQVMKAFGEDSYIDGKINRRKFYKILYGNQSNSDKMNNIVVPYLIDTIKDISSRNHNIVLECPIILNTDIHKIVNHTILVKSDLNNKRIQRLIDRFDGDVGLVKNKIESESFDESKADFILFDNDKLESQIDKLIQLFNIKNDDNMKKSYEKV